MSEPFELPTANPRPQPTAAGGWLPLVGLMVLLWLGWSTWFVFPLKILVVFFHELSHALAALLTGGAVLSIELVAQEGGLAVTAGGSRFLILSAGYLGSVVWGGLLLVLAARSRADRLAVAGLGLLLLGTALLWVRPVLSFGFAFSLVSGCALLAVAAWLSAGVNDFLLRAVGLTSLLYAVFDIQSDILARPYLRESDAARLAALTGIPTLVWGLVWMVLALVGLTISLRLAARGHNSG
jgi:hypothetical protein